MKKFNSLLLGHIKQKFSLPSPPASEFPAASIFLLFFICLIPHDNNVYGFVSLVMKYKSKIHDFLGFLE